MEPAGRIARCDDGRDDKGVQIEDEDRGGAWLSVVGVSKAADDDDAAIHHSRAVKICGRKDIPPISENLDVSVRMLHDDIVVDVKIRVVVIFVFTADQYDAPVVQLCRALAKAIEAPTWAFTERRRAVEQSICLKGVGAG